MSTGTICHGRSRPFCSPVKCDTNGDSLIYLSYSSNIITGSASQSRASEVSDSPEGPNYSQHNDEFIFRRTSQHVTWSLSILLYRLRPTDKFIFSWLQIEALTPTKRAERSHWVSLSTFRHEPSRSSISSANVSMSPICPCSTEFRSRSTVCFTLH